MREPSQARFLCQRYQAHRLAIAAQGCSDRANAGRTVHDLPFCRARAAALSPTDAARKISWDAKRIPPAGQDQLRDIPFLLRATADRKTVARPDDFSPKPLRLRNCPPNN